VDFLKGTTTLSCVMAEIDVFTLDVFSLPVQLFRGDVGFARLVIRTWAKEEN
jgi:hypothetical protein